jgi:TrmH family RNA methyltransferase
MPTAPDRSRLISIVQSRQNARVRELRAAFTRSGREESEVIAIEGEHLLSEALRTGLRLHTVFIRSDPDTRTEPDRRNLRVLERLPLPAPVPIVSLNPAVFASAVETESPQGIAALVEPPHFSLADALAAPNPLIVVAAALQDPGNFGTLIRSAEAFGASGVIALPGTVDVWNSKALRASAGSAFRVPVIAEKSATAFAALAEHRIPLLAAVPGAVPASADSDATGPDSTDPDSTGSDSTDHDATGPAAIPCTEADLTGPIAILIGNEGAGLSSELLERADQRIAIPTPGPVESLNAAVAASILLYEAARQRYRKL